MATKNLTMNFVIADLFDGDFLLIVYEERSYVLRRMDGKIGITNSYPQYF